MTGRHGTRDPEAVPATIEAASGGVTLSTFHAAKGFEFKVVFFVGNHPYSSNKQDRAQQ